MKSILLDAGHGGRDSGAKVAGISEDDIALGIVKQTGRILERHGFYAAYTRTTDTFLSLDSRLMIIADTNPDAFVSVHVNAIADDPRTIIDEQEQISGTEVYYRDENDRPLAEGIDYVFAHSGLWEVNHGARQDKEHLGKRLKLLNVIKTPSALVEVGYLTNRREREMILRSTYEIADLVAHGIMKYLRDKDNG